MLHDDALASIKTKPPQDKEIISSRSSELSWDKITSTHLLNELTRDKEIDSSLSSILPRDSPP